MGAYPHWIDFSALHQRAGDISHAYSSGNLVFFVGSGASKAYGTSLPNWPELLTRLASEIQTQHRSQRDEIWQLIRDRRYLLAAEAIKQYGVFTTDNKDLAVDLLVARILQQSMERAEKHTLLHLAILDYRVPIITTNYDTVIETIVSTNALDIDPWNILTYRDERNVSLLLSPARRADNFLLKLHGSIDQTEPLILDEHDYLALYFHQRWPTTLEFLRHILATRMAIFIGFSLSDPEIMLILREAMRHSSSYQHIALLHKSAISPIEQQVLRSVYRVDPIVYDQHTDLSLFVLEARNFFPREHLSLQLQPERPMLAQTIERIRGENKLPRNSSAILFGSFAKYGALASKEADVDLLFLTDKLSNKISRFHIPFSENPLGRDIDGTILRRSEFEELLRHGDPFVTSVLVTGQPLEDLIDYYNVLARGFVPKWSLQDVSTNLSRRYLARWIRLCAYRNAPLAKYLPAVYQWAMTLMQVLVVENYYPINSLLGLSLLGNSRYLIREFATRYHGVDEDFFVDLMARARRGSDGNASTGLSIELLRQKFLSISCASVADTFLRFLDSGEFVRTGNEPDIVQYYSSISWLLEAIDRGQETVPVGYGSAETEEEFLDTISRKAEVNGMAVTPYDWLFFFRLRDQEDQPANQHADGPEKLVMACKRTRAEWIAQFVQNA